MATRIVISITDLGGRVGVELICVDRLGTACANVRTGGDMSNTQGLDHQALQVKTVGDIMGWLGGLPLALIEDVRMGRPKVPANAAQADGNVGAVDCASGTGECGIGSDCAGGSGICGIGGDCAGH